MNEASEKSNIITKQLVIDLPRKLTSKLLPVTGEKRVIDEIQNDLDNYAKESKLLKLYLKRDEYFGRKVDTSFILDLELQILEAKEELGL